MMKNYLTIWLGNIFRQSVKLWESFFYFEWNSGALALKKSTLRI